MPPPPTVSGLSYPRAVRELCHDVVRGRAVLDARLSRNRIEPPGELARLHVIRTDIATHGILGTAIADDDLARDQPGRARDGVVLRLVDRIDDPQFLACLRIERDQPPIEGAKENAAVLHGHAAIDHVAAALRTGLARHLGIVGPEKLPRCSIKRLHLRPGRGREELPAHHDRGGFLPAAGIEIVEPGQLQVGDIVRLDLIKRTEPVLRQVETMTRPFALRGLGERSDGGCGGI